MDKCEWMSDRAARGMRIYDLFWTGMREREDANERDGVPLAPSLAIEFLETGLRTMIAFQLAAMNAGELPKNSGDYLWEVVLKMLEEVKGIPPEEAILISSPEIESLTQKLVSLRRALAEA